MNKVGSVYIVDDDEAFQFLTERIIKRSKLVNQIMVFSNGLEVINFLKAEVDHSERLPEIIFLDLNMPIMDGWEFLEEYKLLEPGLEKDIMIYIISSSNAPKDIQKAKSISAVKGYIVKPLTKDMFMDLINQI